MDMLEDYLRAVSRLLPRAKRDDIIAELRDEILTRIEARESELNRSLTPDETEQLLRDFGHPIVVAARYRDEPQYSVGPALYPYWIFAVQFAILIEVVVSALVFVVRAITGGNVAEAFGSAIGSGISGVLILIGFATVAAWLIERKGITIDYFKTWRVRDLRFLDFAVVDWADLGEWFHRVNTVHRDRAGRPDRTWRSGDYQGYNGWMMRQSSAGRGVATLVFGVVFILWWVGVLSFGAKPFPLDYDPMQVDPGVFATLDWPALKATVFVPVLIYFTALSLFGLLVLVYPGGVRMRGLVEMVIGGAGLAFVAWVWTASPIASAVAVHSGEELAQRFSAFISHPVPLPMNSVATFILVMMAFGGACRVLGGLWETLVGAPRYPWDGGPD